MFKFRKQRCRAAGLAKQATRANNIYKLFLAERKVSGVRAHSILRRASGIALPLYDDKLRKIWVSDAVVERLHRAYRYLINMNVPIDDAPSLSAIEMAAREFEEDSNSASSEDDELLDDFDDGGILRRPEVWLRGSMRVRAQRTNLSTWTIENLDEPESTFSVDCDGRMTQSELWIAWQAFRRGLFLGRRSDDEPPLNDPRYEGLNPDFISWRTAEIQRSLRRSRGIE